MIKGGGTAIPPLKSPLKNTIESDKKGSLSWPDWGKKLIFFTFIAFFCHPAIIQIWVPKRNKANAGQRCTLACLWVIKRVIVSDWLTDWYCILICCSLTERAKISAELGHFLWFWQKCHVPLDGWTDGQTDQQTDTASDRDAWAHLKRKCTSWFGKKWPI